MDPNILIPLKTIHRNLPRISSPYSDMIKFIQETQCAAHFLNDEYYVRYDLLDSFNEAKKRNQTMTNK